MSSNLVLDYGFSESSSAQVPSQKGEEAGEETTATPLPPSLRSDASVLLETCPFVAFTEKLEASQACTRAERNRASISRERGALPSHPQHRLSHDDNITEAAIEKRDEDDKEVGVPLVKISGKEEDTETQSESEDEGLMMKKYERPAPPPKQAPHPAAASSRSSISITSSEQISAHPHRRGRASGRIPLTASALSRLPYEPFTILQRFFNPQQPRRVVVPKWWSDTVIVEEKSSEKQEVELEPKA
jgi:hypothetical protein